jgi:hypothetical protein
MYSNPYAVTAPFGLIDPSSVALPAVTEFSATATETTEGGAAAAAVAPAMSRPWTIAIAARPR